mgnify:CR=1 FL=1
MQILRLTQDADNSPRVMMTLSVGGQVLGKARVNVNLDLTTQDQEDLRWYLEEYLQYPLDPAPVFAARIEARIKEIGQILFENLFEKDRGGRAIWQKVAPTLKKTRIEIVEQNSNNIPWELILEPKSGHPLPMLVPGFVRTNGLDESLYMVDNSASKIRILLVICRPNFGNDVPFRSVANYLITSLGGESQDIFQIDVLRPPTFERLKEVLQAAKACDQPYHVVHFDGHGLYADQRDVARWRVAEEDINPNDHASFVVGARGFLVFEKHTSRHNMEFVDGDRLGRLLSAAGVPVLVLNACLSAHTDASPKPKDAKQAYRIPHVFGSLAQEVVDAGVPGVIAMRYSVYVMTAAQFIAKLYEELSKGTPLSQAVTIGRRDLYMNPEREVAYKGIPLQDWSVPIVYETTPIRLFSKPEKVKNINRMKAEFDLREEHSTLPPRPEVGFFGRHETMLALDRLFDYYPLILLQAYAGNGKTATVTEFARWYQLTGGIDRVLFTSFEQYIPLSRVLDLLEEVYSKQLDEKKIQWLSLDDRQRRNTALNLLNNHPLLWIWDNVETIAGFPKGTDSAWSLVEQEELRDFLKEAGKTKSRFLLTSRRDEAEWLEKTSRVEMNLPPMPMLERLQLARAIAEKYETRLDDVEDWQPLLEFTKGNPLTLTILVGQAIHKGIKTKEQVTRFVEDLAHGIAAFNDEASEGRSASLGASLAYGFQDSFDEVERRQLALLYLFQGYAHADILHYMGGGEWALPELSTMTRKDAIALLDRAAEIGLLSRIDFCIYSIHPALPWFFRRLFRSYYKMQTQQEAESAPRAARAFVDGVSELCNIFTESYEEGDRAMILDLAHQESNLLQARKLAKKMEMWVDVVIIMQALRVMYSFLGRWAEWTRLVEESIPDFVDPKTDLPLPERDYEWDFINDFRVLLARQIRNWDEAERLQRLSVRLARERADELLNNPPFTLNEDDKAELRPVGVSLNDLGEILYFKQDPKCKPVLEESYALLSKIGDEYAMAVVAYNIGNVHTGFKEYFDPKLARSWYRKSLELRSEHDGLWRAKVYSQMGMMMFTLLEISMNENRPNHYLMGLADEVAAFLHKAIDLLPPSAVGELKEIYGRLGLLYRTLGITETAINYYKEGIRLAEYEGDVVVAGTYRAQIAIALAQVGQLDEAKEYALSSMKYIKSAESTRTDLEDKVTQLLEQIEEKMEEAKKPANKLKEGVMRLWQKAKDDLL